MSGNSEGNDPETNGEPLDRRSVLKVGGAGALSAGFAGCQSPENPVPGGDLRIEEDDGPPGNGNGSEPMEGPLEGETITVGVLAPMNLPLGRSMWNAAQMAAHDLNEDGGILGAHVEVELGDTEVSPGTAESEHRRLVTQENCDLTVGLFLGSALLQTLPSIANQETIHVTTGSAEPRAGQLVSRTNSMTGDDPEEEYERFKYHFRAGPIHLLDLADAMLEFVERNRDEFGWERASVLTENIGEFTPYHDRLVERIDDVIDVEYTDRPGGVSDWTPIFDRVEDGDCDVALIGMALIGTTAVNQWRQQERDFEMGGIHVNSQEFSYWESTDGNCEFIWTMNSMTPQTENTPLTQDFIQRYIDQWDDVPIYTGPLTYDAISLMEQTLEAYDEQEGLDGEMPHADELIPVMEDHVYSGGRIVDETQFTPPDADFAHEPGWTSIEETGVPVFQQWQFDPDVRDDYGTMHAFAPEQNATSDYQFPDWME